MKKVRLYLASKIRHAEQWKQSFELAKDTQPHLENASSWVEDALAGRQVEDGALRYIQDVLSSDAVIVYHEPGEVLKGAFIEMGAALGANIPVIVVGCPIKTGSIFWGHPLVFRAGAVHEAVMIAQNFVEFNQKASVEADQDRPE